MTITYDARWPADKVALAELRSSLRSAIGHLPGVDAAIIELLTNELATNSIVHGSCEFQVVVEVRPTAVRVSVADSDPSPPEVRDAGPDAESGRGIQLVVDLSDDWGHRESDDGKVVWFEVRADEDVPTPTPTPTAG